MSKSTPKYLEVIKWVKAEIEQGALQVGDRLQSENELGEKFSLSRQTIRQATSILESEGILERRRGSGTYVASDRIVPRVMTMNIGVITTYLDDYLFPSVIKGIDQVLTQNGYSMQLSITYNKVENEMQILQSMLEKGVDGLIIEPTKSGLPNLNADLYKQIKKMGIPCIFIHAYYQGMNFPYVAMDDYGCGKAAAFYLMEKNHKKIAGIFKSDDMQGHIRYAGCASGLKKEKLVMHEENIMWFTTEDLKSAFIETFEQRVINCVEGCSAVVCYNDQVALKVTEIFQKYHKQVPEDISMISFDNSDLATRGCVALTTFSHPKAELGKVAAEHLLLLIRKEPFDTNFKFKANLVERFSVKMLNLS